MTGPTALADSPLRTNSPTRAKSEAHTINTNQPSHELRIADELGIAHQKPLARYKNQILVLAMRGGAFQAKAKADPAFRQAATKDTAALRHTAIKVNAELCHVK